jgi:hypothetical protein
MATDIGQAKAHLFLLIFIILITNIGGGFGLKSPFCHLQMFQKEIYILMYNPFTGKNITEHTFVFPSCCVQGYISLKVSSLLLNGYVYMIWVTSNRYVNLGVNSAEEGFNLMWRI